jgi:hypothetical protein
MNRSEFCRGGVCLVMLAALALTPVGCGKAGMSSVSGTVTYNGKPVPKGVITFVAGSPEGRNATGQLDQNGKYRLQTEEPGDGAQVGNYDVTIYAHDEVILDYKPKVPVEPKILAPTKYESPKTSGLKREVKSGANTFDFELTD